MFARSILAHLLNTRKTVNIDLLGVSDLALQVTVAAVLSDVVRLRRENKIDPLIVSFDEAHRIVPRTHSRQHIPPSAYVVKNLIRFGRHYGIGVIAITQFPDSVDIELIRLPATRFVFAVDSEQLGSIRGILGDLPEVIKNMLPKLEKGTAFLAGTADVIRHTLYIRIREDRQTTHGGETPKYRIRI